MIEMAMAKEDHIGPFHLLGREAERPVTRLAIEIGIEQEHLAADS